MIHHPVVLVPKLVVLAVIIIVLLILRTSLSPEQFRIAVAISAAGFAAFIFIFWIVLAHFLRNPGSRLSRIIVLNDTQQQERGYHAASDEFKDLLGRTGVAVSPLRPTGIIMIDNRRIPVQTEGSFIPKDTTVEIVAIKGSRVIVRIPDKGPA